MAVAPLFLFCERFCNRGGIGVCQSGGKRAITLLLTTILLFVTISASSAQEAETRLLISRFHSPVKEGNLEIEVPFSDAWFETPATVYYHPLARATLGMALSAFRRQDAEMDGKDGFIRDYLTQAGFEQLKSQQYDETPSDQSIATMIGQKSIQANGTAYTLLAVAVSGGGYKDEWLSNFSFGSEPYHAGFSSSAIDVVLRISDYLQEHSITGPIKIWMGGYSRAAAVSNIAGYMLSEGDFCQTDDLYVYTFATPNNTRIDSEWACPSIFNIVGAFDPVPSVPFAEWGYGRFGTTLYLPAQEICSDYQSRAAAVGEVYQRLTGMPYWNNPECNWLMQKVFQLLYGMVDTAADYEGVMQDVIKEAWSAKGNTLRLLRKMLDIVEHNTAFDATVEKKSGQAGTLLSVFVYDYAMERLGVTENAWGHAGIAAELLHEHCPDVYAAWMFSEDEPKNLFVAQTNYWRTFVHGDVQITALDASGQEAELSALPLGEETMLSIPADQAYTLCLTARKDTAVNLMVNHYQAGNMQYHARDYEELSLKAGDTVTVSLKAGQGVDDSSCEVTHAGQALKPYIAFLTGEEARPSAVEEIRYSGVIPRNFLLILTIGAAVLTAAALALLTVLIVKAVRRTRKAPKTISEKKES